MLFVFFTSHKHPVSVFCKCEINSMPPFDNNQRLETYVNLTKINEFSPPLNNASHL